MAGIGDIHFHAEIPVGEMGHPVGVPAGGVQGLSLETQALVDLSRDEITAKMERLSNECPSQVTKIEAAIRFVDHVEGVDDEQFLQCCNDFGFPEIAKDFLERIRDSQSPNLKLVDKERVKNMLINKKLYEGEITQFIHQNLDLIIQSFSWQNDFHGQVPEVKFHISDGETHNQGRNPAILTIEAGGTVRKCVFKPRDGRVDHAVLELFNQINGLTLQERTTLEGERAQDQGPPPQLPHFTIINPTAQEGWQLHPHLPNVSLAEFVGQEEVVGQSVNGQGIVGIDPKRFIAANKNIDTFLTNRLRVLQIPNQVQSLRAYRLLRSAFRNLGVADQHNGNYRFDPHQECPMIPIDLEVLERSGRTDMNTQLDYLTLTPAEETLIQNTLQTIQQAVPPFRIRYIPIGTGRLAGLLTLGDAKVIHHLVIEELEKNGVTIPHDLIQGLLVRVQKDIINNDVPIFSRVGPFLFYGDPVDGLLLNQNNG